MRQWTNSSQMSSKSQGFDTGDREKIKQNTHFMVCFVKQEPSHNIVLHQKLHHYCLPYFLA